MNENRFIAVILCVVFVVGAVSLGVFYYATSYRHDREIMLSSTHRIQINFANAIKKDSAPVYPDPSPLDTVTSLVDQSKREPDASSESVLGDKVTLLANQPTKKPASIPLSSKSLQKKIYEISKANGNFNSAQEIMEGVIIGKRGTVRDRGDYYKVQATGNTMTLKLKPLLKDENHRFIITVFDVNQRLIGGGNSEDTSQAITLAVTPQTTYYIKLDLNRAPIETPQYRLSFRFKQM
jgi:hypothetical protein